MNHPPLFFSSPVPWCLELWLNFCCRAMATCFTQQFHIIRLSEYAMGKWCNLFLGNMQAASWHMAHIWHIKQLNEAVNILYSCLSSLHPTCPTGVFYVSASGIDGQTKGASHTLSVFYLFTRLHQSGSQVCVLTRLSERPKYIFDDLGNKAVLITYLCFVCNRAGWEQALWRGIGWHGVGVWMMP